MPICMVERFRCLAFQVLINYGVDYSHCGGGGLPSMLIIFTFLSFLLTFLLVEVNGCGCLFNSSSFPHHVHLVAFIGLPALPLSGFLIYAPT